MHSMNTVYTRKRAPGGVVRKFCAPDARKFLTKFLKSGVRRKIKKTAKKAAILQVQRLIYVIDIVLLDADIP